MIQINKIQLAMENVGIPGKTKKKINIEDLTMKTIKLLTIEATV